MEGRAGAERMAAPGGGVGRCATAARMGSLPLAVGRVVIAAGQGQAGMGLEAALRRPLAPLLTALLLPRADALAHLWHKAALERLCLRDALVVRDDLQDLTRPSQMGRYALLARR